MRRSVLFSALFCWKAGKLAVLGSPWIEISGSARSVARSKVRAANKVCRKTFDIIDGTVAKGNRVQRHLPNLPNADSFAMGSLDGTYGLG
jgi:hypothetical protein